MYKSSVLALAAIAAALPAPQSGSALGAVPPKDMEFGLVMKVDGTFVSLNAVSNGTVGNLVLQGQRLSAYPGTPGTYLNLQRGPQKNKKAPLKHNGAAYINGTKPFKALNFDVDGEAYGIGLPRVGDEYGYAGSAFAIFGYQEFSWVVTENNTIDHKRDAAWNDFYGKSSSDSLDEADSSARSLQGLSSKWRGGVLP